MHFVLLLTLAAAAEPTSGLDLPSLAVPIIVAILSGGCIGSLVTLWTAKKKVPAERDNIIVSGAEQAVTTLERALAAETRRAERAEKQVAERDELIRKRDKRIERLEQQMDEMQAALERARQELHAIRVEGHPYKK